MNKISKIYIAGHTGLVGSAILRQLQSKGYSNLLLRTHSELDLANQKETLDFFIKEKPEFVFLAAAKVGGIHANNIYPAEFIYQNLIIECNVIHSAYKSKVKKLLFLGSSCIYPKSCPQPINEEYLLASKLEPSNEPYAISKIAGIKLCQSYNRQYGTNFIAAMPTNLYGPEDNFDLKTSHVLPALIRRLHEAKINKSPEVVVWGSGKPMREFLHVDDMAGGCITMMMEFSPTTHQNDTGEIFMNIGTGKDLTIKELVGIVKEVVGYTGVVKWDKSKPDGTPRKLLNISKIASLGWKARISFKDGIKHTYNCYKSIAK